MRSPTTSRSATARPASAPDPQSPRTSAFVQDWDTAVAVATGELNAQEAFIGGRIMLTGDQQKLLDSQPVFGRSTRVFTAVRERTEYR